MSLILLPFLLPPIASFLLYILTLLRALTTTSPRANLPAPFSTARRILLLTAHPDDECMFFAPTIIRLVEAGVSVHVLCASVGNAAGLGNVRARELVQSCKVLGIKPAHRDKADFTVFITPSRSSTLQDSMTVWWDEAAVADVVSKHLRSAEFDSIITFDSQGISNHPNHRALYSGIRRLKSTNPTPAYSLRTVSLPRKYISILDLVFTCLQPASALFVSSPLECARAQRAMIRHTSQMVWFRHLYIVFSRYMVVNELDRVV
ncbi:putative deacetylase LmbE-like domain-containing protein [Blyttiomyces helicus]|uniref:N-acetylglucosaminylphosphatidylinositol deacetylase n=1 Tax=Blyttiomyces helicus TaxID=388810 RepID=A0A4P9W130_9FUNG|nr:putative deacetylase LmbE-like domain-containing protein [Blyttiomyces helicus]|eukprot:RKO83766.1 putative deacetylase LmbE-like domain-containing protein [Blyttiomyces helicus]